MIAALIVGIAAGVLVVLLPGAWALLALPLDCFACWLFIESLRGRWNR